MNIFKKRKQKVDDDKFDRTLVHVGKDLPLEDRNRMWKEFFYPIVRAGFKENITDEAIQDASLIRVEANGSMHTRVIIDDGFGKGIDAIDVDGRVGELLWVLCKNPGNPDIITEPKTKKIKISHEKYVMMIWDELLDKEHEINESIASNSLNIKPSDKMAHRAVLAMLHALESTYNWDRDKKQIRM